MSVKKPHKQAELIKAWADGAEIQCKNRFGEWVEIDLPLWYTDTEYRIKPEPKEYWVINPYRQVFGPYTKERAFETIASDASYWKIVKEVKEDDKD